MRNFFRALWRIVTAPFRALWRIITLPIRVFRRVRDFMQSEPASHTYGEIFSSLTNDKDYRAEMIENIEQFRKHLLRSVVMLFISAGVAWYFINPITAFLAVPIGGPQNLQVIDLTEAIGVYMKIAFTVGLALALPYIAFEFWLFAAPGLTPRERWISLVGIPLTAVLFVAGVAFTYYYMLPVAIPLLQNIGDFQSNPTADRYYSLITRLLLWIGLFFEFPLVTTILTSIGILTPKGLISQWRLAIILIGVIAALITPTTDMGSMALVMAPMTALYFISIGLSAIVYRGKRSRSKNVAPEPTT
jgi:sec-independent protein translocase protein TatC